ncbi:MAG: hypothetical protein ACYSW8_30370 [Planctomycetota bacterium]
MKKLLDTIIMSLIILLTLPGLAYASEEDPKMPFHNTCQTVNGHKQEQRWCAAWANALERLDKIRPRQQNDQMGLHSLVLVEFCERTRTLGVGTTVIFVSGYFAGQFPWVLSSLKVVEPGDWTDVANDLVEQMWAAFEEASEGLGIAIQQLNTLEERRYQNVRGQDYGAEYQDLDDPFERERNILDIELCEGTDVVLHLSRP